MKKALVTGANGFVGSALVRDLLKNGVEVIALDREGCNNNIPDSTGVTFVPFELSGLSAAGDDLKKYGADTFFHLAWAGMNGPTRGDPQIQMRNAMWTVDALRTAKEIGCGRFVAAGSIMEYETYSAVMAQGNKPGINYVYGASKLAARSMCACLGAQLGIDVVWAEISNAYGPGELSPRLINSTLRKIIAGEPLQFTSGTQNYDFVYIDDVARAFRLIGESGKPFHHYMIGSSNAKPLREFLLEIKEAVAPDREFQFGDVPFTGTNLPLSAFDCTMLREDTGFIPEVAFSDGIRRTMDWLEKNQIS